MHTLSRKYCSHLFAGLINQVEKAEVFRDPTSVFSLRNTLCTAKLLPYGSHKGSAKFPWFSQELLPPLFFSSPAAGGRHGRDRQAAKGRQSKIKALQLCSCVSVDGVPLSFFIEGGVTTQDCLEQILWKSLCSPRSWRRSRRQVSGKAWVGMM